MFQVNSAILLSLVREFSEITVTELCKHETDKVFREITQTIRDSNSFGREKSPLLLTCWYACFFHKLNSVLWTKKWVGPFQPKCWKPSRWGATVVQPGCFLFLRCNCALLHCLIGQVQGHLNFAVGFRQLFRRVKTTVLKNLRIGLPQSVVVWKANKILGLGRKGVERETTLFYCSVNSQSAS